MKRILLGALVALTCAAVFAGSKPDSSETLVAMERKAMDEWKAGNPDGFLSISDDEITFLHNAVTEKRLEGLTAVKAMFESYRGAPLFDSYEIADPKVQEGENMAVLTYRLVTHNGTLIRQWDATQVYRQNRGVWRIIHTHFSNAKPTTATKQ